MEISLFARSTLMGGEPVKALATLVVEELLVALVSMMLIVINVI